MATRLRRCFNGHVTDHAGCAGCHHAFHVVEAGKIQDGRLVPPVVDGPIDCELCHKARHPSPVDGCPECEGTFDERLEVAMSAAKPFRQEMWSLKFVSWFLGWQMWLASWMTMLAGGTMWDWFRRPDGSQDWLKAAIAFAAVPVVQWFIRRKVARDERLLPHLDRRGHIVYGSDSRPRED